MNKLSKHPPEWHAQIAEELSREYAETNELSETARRRRARLGMMFIFVKEMGKADKSIPHGQFGPWLEKNCPAIKRSTAGDYIAESKSMLKVLGWQNSEIRKFELPPHRLLIADSGELSDKDRSRQKALIDVVDQKRFRAITKYSQVKLIDDESVPARGRRPGEGGNSKEQRANAAERDEREKLEALQSKADEVADWLLDNADVKNFGKLDELSGGAKTLKNLADAVSYAHNFFETLKKSTK